MKVSTNCSNPQCGKQIPFDITKELVGKSIKVTCPFCHQQKVLVVPQSLASKFNSVPTPEPETITDGDHTIIGQQVAEASLFLETLASTLTPAQLFTISSGYNTVGRKNESGPEHRPDVEVKTEDKKMSRIHAAITKKSNGGFTLKNLPSGKNGLRLNGKDLENGKEVYLKSGDSFRLGETMFRVTIKSSRAVDKDETDF